MQNERILPYQLSKKLNEEDLQDVSAAGTSIATGNVTYNPQTSGTDANADVQIDL